MGTLRCRSLRHLDAHPAHDDVAVADSAHPRLPGGTVGSDDISAPRRRADDTAEGQSRHCMAGVTDSAGDRGVARRHCATSPPRAIRPAHPGGMTRTPLQMSDSVPGFTPRRRARSRCQPGRGAGQPPSSAHLDRSSRARACCSGVGVGSGGRAAPRGWGLRGASGRAARCSGVSGGRPRGLGAGMSLMPCIYHPVRRLSSGMPIFVFLRAVR